MSRKFVLSLRERHVGGAVASGHLYCIDDSGRVMDWDANLQVFTNDTRMGNQRLLVLLHGYNNTYEEGLEALARYMTMLDAGGFGDIMLAVLWPGDGWAKALSFPTEASDADDSAAALCRWLETNVDKRVRISFIAHSLGCRVAMHAAALLAGNRRGPALGRICLMAAAINNDSLGHAGRTPSYRAATLAAERVAVLSSKKDTVLEGAYPLGEIAWTVLRGEHWGLALGYTGPMEHDAEVLAKIEPQRADPSRSIDHFDYLGPATSKTGKPDQPLRTRSRSEVFAFEFLTGAEKVHWPAAQPDASAAVSVDMTVRP